MLKTILVPGLLTFTLSAGLYACSPAKKAKPELGSFGVALDAMDRSIMPGDNFFKYVNGKWLAETEIPADKSSYGAFTILGDRSEERVRAIIQDMARAETKPGSNEQKIGDLYAAFMDTDAIEKAGLTLIKADLAGINAVKSHEDVAKLMGDPSMEVQAPVGGWVDVDFKDTENYIFYMTQSGLGMPNRGYYLDEDDKSLALRKDYVIFLTAMLEAVGTDNAAERAQAVMDFETTMAKSHWEPEKRRQRDLTYNKMTMDRIEAYAPGFPWRIMAGKAGLENQQAFIVRENDALQGLAKTFGETSLDILRDYMVIHYLASNAAYLPKVIDDAHFAFYGKALRGAEKQRERWKRGVSQVSGVLGEAIGQVYVKRHFPPDAKRQMDELVENLRAAFRDGIDNLEWMSADTKIGAQDKLAKFYPKIGYPKKWKDYSSLEVYRDDLVSSAKSANVWHWNDMISKLGKPIDREEWGMYPQTVNAYYRPSLNEIVFPAAILQAPFFDPNADPAVNYGGIGAVIGHEMGHGFDDQGSKTDGNGRQRNWWTPEDEAAFMERGEALVAQYEAFEPLPGEYINGELTLGENIGDLTGLTMGYAAYKKSLNGREVPVIDGFTGDQRFFLAYGQIWKGKFRDKALRERLKSDPHSPGEYRANGIVRNFDDWYDAFNVQPGDALYLPPEDRVKIW